MGLKEQHGQRRELWQYACNTATPYYGRVEGPIRLQFGETVTMTIPELKVVKGTRTDPLLILGCDFMMRGQEGQWDFVNIGTHLFTR